MNFQENASNENRDITERADHCPSKVSLIIDPSQPNLGHVGNVQGIYLLHVAESFLRS